MCTPTHVILNMCMYTYMCTCVHVVDTVVVLILDNEQHYTYMCMYTRKKHCHGVANMYMYMY